MITVHWDDKYALAGFERLSKALTAVRPVYEDIGQYMVASTQDRVERGETPEGMPFAPRSQTTLEMYARKNFSYGLPLNRSGVMRLGIFAEVTDEGVRVGSNAEQAAIMQFGGRGGAVRGIRW